MWWEWCRERLEEGKMIIYSTAECGWVTDVWLRPPHISDHALLQRSPVVALLTSWFRWRPNGWEFVVSMVFNQLPWKKNGKSDTCDLLVESDSSAAKIDPRTLRADPPQPSHPNNSSRLTEQYTHVVVHCCAYHKKEANSDVWVVH